MKTYIRVVVNVSDQTLRNRLHEGDLRAQCPPVSSVPTAWHSEALVAADYQNCHHWYSVLFTDQSRFTLSISSISLIADTKLETNRRDIFSRRRRASVKSSHTRGANYEHNISSPHLHLFCNFQVSSCFKPPLYGHKYWDTYTLHLEELLDHGNP